MKKILIPANNGFTRSALATCRAITPKCEIHILSETKSLMRFQNLLKTKFCTKYDFCINSMNNPKEFISQIKSYTKKNKIDIILPFSDSDASLLSYYKEEIDAHIPLPSYKIFQKAIDKYQITKIAESLNIPIPKTIELSNFHNIDKVLKRNNLSYPLILKPKIRGDNLLGTKIINSKKELSRYYEYFSSIGKKIPIYNYKNPIIQEFLNEGMIYDCCTLTSNGELIASLCQYRARQMNPYGGIGVVNITCKNEKLIKHSKKLLETIKYKGPAQIEWLRTRKGTFKLLEINPRFWGTLELSIYAGINFPELTLKMLENEFNWFNKPSYLLGLKERWIFPQELISIIKSRKNHPSRFLEYLNFLEIFKSNVKINIQGNDLKPHIFDLLYLIEKFKDNLIKKVK